MNLKKTSLFFRATFTTVAGTLSALAMSTSAYAATLVDLELSLLVDVSGSVDSTEFQLQRDGYVNAFSNPNLFNNFISKGNIGKIAVNYIYWSSTNQQQQTVGWTLIDSVAAAQNFAAAISAAPRPFSGNTGIGSAINFATPLFFNNDFEGVRKVIDVSGDGSTNIGANTAAARDAALAAGVDAINGLVIGNSTSLFNFYNNNVKGGTGSFVLQANTFQDFADTVERKLRREIVTNPQGTPEPATLIGLFGLGAFGITSNLKRNRKQPVKC
ncbi:Protein of unknown function DUF1194 [Trichormus variabilis ATCC 29413]|uniref:VWFA domain-containing protein n=2 Tax=Anabaena variabilis TaxID=264691 RepID=Q3MAR9_TRIV2|nr:MULTISPECIES: DUF1194 domain-containing protein [Nostocaceae]ABA21917.1 Protein of unknown function DUF1194 [Trichormus variabilis ATCC 29413]MBC1213386.1 DUF1194 domain-containing protein [Trichormus variabilis ARAD]MBC1255100.1 DUF1194 domain-containing protein [Trichormus variabilis V5]MBC1268838.1 DUF1194 domain-containing protein [Trichormus variabilis FSR]MBC1302378.1 DUF1194 domain-containing protein [Trichormus variabilis N2B]